MNKDSWENDRRLIERWQNGDESAFEEIYRQNAKKVKDFLTQRYNISPPEIAEDLFDEAMLALHQRKHTYQVTGLISTYLCRIIKNKYINELRKLPKDFIIVPLDSLSKSHDEDESWEWEKDETHSVDFKYDTDDADMIVQQALSLMKSSLCKEIFLLKYWNGLTLKEIAIQLDRNESYVRRRINECAKLLKEIIEQLISQNDDKSGKR